MDSVCLGTVTLDALEQHQRRFGVDVLARLADLPHRHVLHGSVDVHPLPARRRPDRRPGFTASAKTTLAPGRRSSMKLSLLVIKAALRCWITTINSVRSPVLSTRLPCSHLLMHIAINQLASHVK